MVEVNSSDNKGFIIEKKIAEKSVLLKNLLEDIGEADENPIPLPNVSADILAKGVCLKP